MRVINIEEIPVLRVNEFWNAHIRYLVDDGIISGGMIPKVECCIEAIKRGVKKVFIMDGRIPHSILIETLTDEGAGTMVVEKRANK